jgi:hypothetical protein
MVFIIEGTILRTNTHSHKNEMDDDDDDGMIMLDGIGIIGDHIIGWMYSARNYEGKGMLGRRRRSTKESNLGRCIQCMT